jgi:hypothetical protein
MKLPDNFQMREHSRRGRFHIIFGMASKFSYQLNKYIYISFYIYIITILC